MARPVRIRVAGGLYHVCARGHDRQALFTDRSDYAHFLELIEEMFEEIVAIVERLKGETWADFRNRYGDWGRDVVLWAGRRSLVEMGRAAAILSRDVGCPIRVRMQPSALRSCRPEDGMVRILGMGQKGKNRQQRRPGDFGTRAGRGFLSASRLTFCKRRRE